MGGWLRTSYDDEPERFGRAFGHWSLSQYAYYYDDLATVPKNCKILSLRRGDKNWGVLPNLGALEEITAINPDKSQLSLIYSCKGLKRLRLCNTRFAHFDGIEALQNLEELACFSVSGPKSLDVVGMLPKLRSILIENMRSLKDWAGLENAKALRCLCMSGGFVEAKQEIKSLAFLAGLTQLRHLHTGSVHCRDERPAFEGLKQLKYLETLHFNSYFFSLDDCAYLEAIVPGEKRLCKGLYTVGGSDRNNIATTLDTARLLPGETLKFCPHVKTTRGLPFTREYQGDREDVLSRVEAFEQRYLKVQRAMELT